MGRTCGEPDEIKKNTHPKYFTALFREQAPVTAGDAEALGAVPPVYHTPNAAAGGEGGAGLLMNGLQANTAYESALLGGVDRPRANSVYTGFGPDTTSSA